MQTVRRVLHAMAAGEPLRKVARELSEDGIPSPTGKDRWHPHVVKRIVGQDAYRPHSSQELAALAEGGNLDAAVLERLAPATEFGVVWYGKAYYRKDRSDTRKATPSPKEERVAVPVPASGVDSPTVDRARVAIAGSFRPSRADDRVWALSGGIAFCPCGRRLVPKRTTTGGKVYWYLACGSYWN